MIECDFALKIDDILSLIQKYNPQIITKKSDYLEVKIVNEFDEELWIEVDDMISIFFECWHTHYFAYEEEYSAFLEDLFGILENKKFVFGVYKENHWCCSDISKFEIPYKENLQNEYGKDKIIKCYFWDKSKNVIFD